MSKLGPITLSPEGAAVLDEAMTSIAQNPSTWSQEAWTCNTTACLAGHIVRNRGLVQEVVDGIANDPDWNQAGVYESYIYPISALVHLGVEPFSLEADKFRERIFYFTEVEDDNQNVVYLDGSVGQAFDMFADEVEELTGMNFSHQREIYRKHFEEV